MARDHLHALCCLVQVWCPALPSLGLQYEPWNMKNRKLKVCGTALQRVVSVAAHFSRACWRCSLCPAWCGQEHQQVKSACRTDRHCRHACIAGILSYANKQRARRHVGSRISWLVMVERHDSQLSMQGGCSGSGSDQERRAATDHSSGAGWKRSGGS